VTVESSAESVESSDDGDSSSASTNYEVRKILQMYSDPGFVSSAVPTSAKITSPTTKSERK
jgi:hypothetical protein